MKIKDRIKRFDRVFAKDLIPNAKNWRTHPTKQQDALKGILAEVGWADALLVRETPNGLLLIDGHLRAETAPDQLVPILVLDVDEQEADKLLATLDPLAAMAEANKDALAALLDDIQTDSAALNAMLEAMRLQHGLDLDEGKEFDESSADDVKMLTCPHCGETFPK